MCFYCILLTVLQKNQWFSLMPFFTTDHHCELFAWNIESAQRKLLKTPIVQSMHYITSNYNNMVLNGTFTHVVVLFLIYPSLPHWRWIEKSLLLIQDMCTKYLSFLCSKQTLSVNSGKCTLPRIVLIITPHSRFILYIPF